MKAASRHLRTCAGLDGASPTTLRGDGRTLPASLPVARRLVPASSSSLHPLPAVPRLLIDADTDCGPAVEVVAGGEGNGVVVAVSRRDGERRAG